MREHARNVQKYAGAIESGCKTRAALKRRRRAPKNLAAVLARDRRKAYVHLHVQLR
jgi:hypothetical protein